MVNSCIKKLSKEQILELEENENINIIEFLDYIKKNEANKLFDNDMKNIRKSFKDKIIINQLDKTP